MTTSRAPFIESARSRGELYIRQPYELYTEANHAAWRQLYSRMRPRWKRFANPHFLDGLSRLA
ncbi:MAG: phenylalanine 4-monooxygenase, partial [Bryobacteraceae bacterium]